MPDVFPVGGPVDWVWDRSGAPQFERSLRSTAPWEWGTAGTAVRELTIVPGSVDWQWGTGGTDSMERTELLVGTGLKLSLYYMSDPDERIAIIRYELLEFEEGLSGVYGGKAEVGMEWFDPAWLEQPILWRVDVEGVERSAFITQDNRDFKVSRDGKRVEITGRTTGEVLSWATIAPADFGGPNQSVTRRFTLPRPAILHQLFGEAQARGAIPMVSAAVTAKPSALHGEAGPESRTAVSALMNRQVAR